MCVFTYLASPHYLGYPIQQKLQTNNFVLRVMALEFDFFSYVIKCAFRLEFSGNIVTFRRSDLFA